MANVRYVFDSMTPVQAKEKLEKRFPNVIFTATDLALFVCTPGSLMHDVVITQAIKEMSGVRTN
ncbi:MAG: hypothetical protein ACLUD1_02895 [Clostridia bacterium]